MAVYWNPTSKIKMINSTPEIGLSKFSEDVILGFSKNQKCLPSLYFYNEKGNRLFQAIMQSEDYYPTACEYEILEKQANQILSPFRHKKEFNLVDFGAGDGKKTRLLISYLIENNIPFTYTPIDISGDILKELKKNLELEFSGIRVKTLENDYFSALEEINQIEKEPKLILFLGSNIGNLTEQDSIKFLQKLHRGMNPGDRLLLGVDLKKDPKTILLAYNDREGITREFNLNILDRMNEELGANFNRKKFYHYPLYDPETGFAKSFLVSIEDQSVYFELLQTTYFFKKGESIFLEISRKYTLENLQNWAELTGFTLLKNLTDSKNYFVDSLWEKTNA